MKRTMAATLAALIILAVAVAAAGCGGTGEVGDGGLVSTTEPASSTTDTTAPGETTTTIGPSTTTTTASEPKMTVKVYFSRDERMSAAGRVVPKTAEVGTAAIKALLEGPTREERELGMVSNIPKGTTFLGLTINDGIATVDLSKEYASGGGTLSMTMRLAEVVFTLTQFPTVKGVNFKLDGEPVEVFGGEGIILDHPVDRSDYEDLSPAILVESPLPHQEVSSPLRMYGTANTFEATFVYNIVNWDGLIIAEHFVMASSGTGTRGTFDVTVPFSIDRSGNGALIVFEQSAEDGRPIHVVEIPLKLVR